MLRSQDIPSDDISTRIRPAVVAILDAKGDYNGTGFFITSDGYLLTCYHVVKSLLKPSSKIKIRTIIGNEVDVNFEANKSCTEAYRDFAILKANEKELFPCLRLGKNFSVGDNWCSRGYSFPATFEDVTYRGEIIEKIYRKGGNRGYDIRLRSIDLIKGGSSGSPLLDEKTGFVVGVINSRPSEHGDRQIFATPVEDIFERWPELEKLNSDSTTHIEIRPNMIIPFSQIWNVPLQPNPNFIGRINFLDKLFKSLNSDEPSAWKQAITGLGGVGKTQIAMRYAYSHRSDYKVIWWVNSEQPAILAANYSGLASRLDLPEKDSSEQKVIIAATKRWFEQNSDWLLIFDNAQEPKDLRDYLPTGGYGHVIITSRDPNWSGVANVLNITEFSPDEAIEFLLKRTGQKDKEAARALAEVLGRLPLALEQAGAYIRETPGISISDYIFLFKERHHEVWKEETSPMDYKDKVDTTWRVSMDKIREESPDGADLLNLFAFLGPDDISLGILSQGKDVLPEPLASVVIDKLKLGKATRSLSRYSLINANGDSISVHRLVQAVTRDRLPVDDQKKWAKAAVQLVDAAFIFDQNNVQTWTESSRLLSHALASTENGIEFEVVPETTSRLLNKISLYLWRYGRLEEAKKNLQKSLEIDEKEFGPNNSNVARDAINLGLVLLDLFDLREAKKNAERAIEIDENVLGTDHLNVSREAYILGMILRELGDFENSKENFEKALRIDKKILGPDHPNVARDIDCLGIILLDLGDFEEAKKNFEKALEINEKNFGPDHPETTLVMSNLGFLLINIGDYDDGKQNFETAKKLLEKAFEIDRKRWGLYHPSVTRELSNLGLAMRGLGDLIGAKTNIEMALEIHEKMFGPDNHYIAQDYTDLGSVLLDLEDFEGAKRYSEIALQIDTNVLNQDNPRIALEYQNLGRSLKGIGDVEGAKENLEKAVQILRKSLGEGHPRTKRASNYLETLNPNA